MATTKAEEAKADRLMQSIASLGKGDAPQILAWLRDGWSRKVFLMEDISSGKNSSVGTAIGQWVRGRHALPTHQHEIAAFRSPGDIVRAMPQSLVEPVISNRQDMLFDRSKAQIESWSHTFPSGMTLTIPFTTFAAVSASVGTTWCTGAMKDNRFEQYAEMTPILIMRLPSGEMYQASFDVSESGLTETVQMDGGSVENLSSSLERFITNGLTVKNAMDENLTLDQYQGFMPFFQDVIPMLARYIERVYGGEWERIVKAVSSGEDVDDDLEMDVSYLSQLLTDAVEHDEDDAPLPEIDEDTRQAEIETDTVTKSESPSVRFLSPDHVANLADMFDESPGAVRKALRRILLDCGPSGLPEHAEAIEVLHRFGDHANTAFLLDVVDGFNSSDFFPPVGEKAGAIVSLVESLGVDRFGDLMVEAWRRSGNLRKASYSIMSSLSDDRLISSYSRFLDRIEKDEADDLSQPQIIDFVAMRSEMARPKDAAGLPDHIRELPWMDERNRHAVRLGYLIEGADRLRLSGQFGIRDVLGIMHEYSPITEGMKAFPDGIARLLSRDGKFSPTEYIETVATLFDSKERSFFDDHVEWDGAFDAIASTLIAKFDDIQFPETNARTACVAALAGMDRKAARLAPRGQRWLFDAFAFRGVVADDVYGWDEKVKTSLTRGASIDTGLQAWEFLSANDIPLEEVGRARLASGLSSLIPHPDAGVLAEIEAVKSGTVSDDKVSDLAGRVYAVGLEQFDAAKGAFLRASAQIIRAGEYQSVLGEAMQEAVKDVEKESRLLTDGKAFVQTIDHRSATVAIPPQQQSFPSL